MRVCRKFSYQFYSFDKRLQYSLSSAPSHVLKLGLQCRKLPLPGRSNNPAKNGSSRLEQQQAREKQANKETAAGSIVNRGPSDCHRKTSTNDFGCQWDGRNSLQQSFPIFLFFTEKITTNIEKKQTHTHTHTHKNSLMKGKIQ